MTYGASIALAPRSSLLVVGPTQSGKTSSLVVPALLRWGDAAVVTSVKHDVVHSTLAWRQSLGTVQLLEPGLDHGLTWNPLEGVTTMREALRVARDMTTSSDRADTEFWNALATKLVAALFVLAVQGSRSIFDVARLLEHRDFDAWLSHSGEPTAVVEHFLAHDPKTLDGVVTTAETMLLPWRFVQPLGDVRSVLDGPNTLYLCSPRAHQRHYEPLFRGALRLVLDAQQALVERGAHRRVLVILDEAASVASLDELDQLAATVSGLDVTLVTIVQDFAQLSARWGARAPTIVNNHTTRLVLGGLADPTVATFLPELTEAREGHHLVPLRQRAAGTAMLVAGRRRAVEVRMRPWWRERRLRARGER